MKIILMAVLILTSGCASTSERRRLLVGIGVGATAGAVGGALLSPNDESRGMNALVFGLGGALVGGALSVLTASEPEVKDSVKSLKDKELGAVDEFQRKEYVVPVGQELPVFIKSRIKPAIIEEYEERDSVSEDGSLRAPHKVYRIKQQVELFPNPKASGVAHE